MVFLINTCNAQDIYQFSNSKQQAQFAHLLKELRCPVCQNQDLADSNAQVAKDLRQQVYNLVVSGNSDDEIIKNLTNRFGDFILFKPRVKSLTYILWFGPLLFFFLGVLVFLRSTSRSNHGRI
jgi:cytochrome c-type biogenesis protein CcmH